MHCIILQNIFLFILHFLLSFIKHQNILSVLKSHVFRQSRPAGLHTARTRSSGPNREYWFLWWYQKSVKTRRVFFWLVSRVILANGTAAGDAGAACSCCKASCPLSCTGMPAGHGAVGTVGKVCAGKWLLWQLALPVRCRVCFLLRCVRSEEKILRLI